MHTEKTNRLATKLFVGCPLGPELRIKLNQSSAWKESRLTVHSEGSSDPVEVHYNEREYLGYFVPQEMAQVRELRRMGDTIKDTLKRYIPELDSEAVGLTVFPQIFVS